ncbi:hypothetical protein [Streptomyces sp. 8N706]|uniref:hypothetical protein n=1 Tax=Streptomyces sp. 8N706 TaxID=3457416 RepID=UPI003FD6BF44
MLDGQLPEEVAEFADYLQTLLEALDPESGWYGVFAQRDPEGIRACLEGREVLPWDVVDALLQDVAVRHGPSASEGERLRAERLHRASVAAHDLRGGGRDALQDRLDVMLRERQYAAARERELSAALASSGGVPPSDSEGLATDLAWARDDLERATARCEEIRARLAVLDRAEPPPDERPTAAPAAPLRGARFAGLDDVAEDLAPAAPVVPEAPAPAPAPAPAKPRGARFAGAYDAAEEERAPRAPRAPKRAARADAAPRAARADAAPRKAGPEAGAAARRETVETVERLASLRASGRSGEAYIVLCEAAAGPAERLPLLLAGLEGAGLAADVATLLWEAACLPPPALAATAAALTDAGRTEDCGVLLRQAVARPAPEVAGTVLALHSTSRASEAEIVLAALLRTRTAEEAARVAESDPGALVPLLLTAADAVSRHCHRGLAHALRMAGLPGAPGVA